VRHPAPFYGRKRNTREQPKWCGTKNKDAKRLEEIPIKRFGCIVEQRFEGIEKLA